MQDIFFSGFYSMAQALVRIFLIILFAGYLVRKGIITKNHIDSLSAITVLVLLPALVFGNTLQYFDPHQLSYWWLLPILGIALSLIGLLLAKVVFGLNRPDKNNLLALSSMQNAGYLVLPIGQVVYPEQFATFSLLTFLFILGYNPILWTLGKYLITSKQKPVEKFQFKSIITPPAAANVISLIIVLLGIQHFIPKPLVQSADFLGKAAIPIATFVLGATLGSISLKKLPNLADTLKVISVKYILLPVLTISILYLFNIGNKYPLLADFLVIQAAAAPATGLILQVRTYGGNQAKVAGIMFITYIICLFALPFWIAFWHTILQL